MEGAQFSDGSAIPDGKVRRLVAQSVKAPHASALTHGTVHSSAVRCRERVWCVQVHIVDLATEMIANTAILCSAVDGYIETLSAIAKSNTPPDATSSGTNSRLVYPRTFKDKMQARLPA